MTAGRILGLGFGVHACLRCWSADDLRHVAGIVCIARGGFILAGDFSSFCPRLLTIVICVVFMYNMAICVFVFFVCGETGDILKCMWYV